MKPNEIVYRPDMYYEGIIQLRPLKKDLLEHTLKQVNKIKGCYVMKLVILKEGYDIYLTSQKATQNIGSKLRKTFKGTLKKSRTLHTFNKLTSKQVYRVTVCFRLEE